MLKWLVKVAVMTVVLVGVAMAPLIIAAEILAHDKGHTSHAPTHQSSATTPLERLKRGG